MAKKDTNTQNETAEKIIDGELPPAASDVGGFINDLVAALYTSNPSALGRILSDWSEHGLLVTIEDAKYALNQVLLQDRKRHEDKTLFDIEWLQASVIDVTRTIHGARLLLDRDGF